MQGCQSVDLLIASPVPRALCLSSGPASALALAHYTLSSSPLDRVALFDINLDLDAAPPPEFPMDLQNNPGLM